jgi:hypothetical protein
MHKAVFAALMAGAVLQSLPALADAREDVVNGMTRCAAIPDDRQWLDCYYGAAQPMRAWLGLTPAPQSQLRLLQQTSQPMPGAGPALPATVSRAAVRTGPPPKPRSSGLFDVFGGDAVVQNAPIQSYDIKNGRFTVTLPDGQVWRQTEADAAKSPVHWDRPASSMRVSINQGAMHSFNLVLGDENEHYKVTRVR